HPAEFALVVKKQSAVVGKRYCHPRRLVGQLAHQAVGWMAGSKKLFTTKNHLSCHLKVNDQAVPSIQINDKNLGTPTYVRDGGTNQELAHIIRCVRKTFRPIMFHRRDFLADNKRMQSAADSFDFW